MKRLVPLFILVVIVTAAITLALRARMKPAPPSPVAPESITPAPDLDTIPGDSVFFGRLEAHRQEMQEFARGDESPLEDADRAGARLNYFPPAPAWRVTARLTRFSHPDSVILLDTKGNERNYLRWGTLHFRQGGRGLELTLYRDPGLGHYFLPFTDATPGSETYRVGRYLEPMELGNDLFLLDFNRAYNPYCAYSHRWACPIPPEENRLTVAVEAGEKKFHQD